MLDSRTKRVCRLLSYYIRLFSANSIILIAYSHSTRGLLVVYLWSTCGLLVVYLWSTRGILVVNSWSTRGLLRLFRLVLVPIWENLKGNH
eukprot:scaffold25568_cov78-Attheya_sp.AAC.4